jgi:predicted nucleic acid-binding protein
VAAVLVDAGPLVALLDRSDPHHERCKRAFAAMRDPLVTVWPVVTEAIYLVSDVGAQNAILEMIALDAPSLLPLGKDDVPRIRELMTKYADLPMDLADAALVRVAEREGLRRVMTIDRRDFSVYRAKGIGKLALLP